MGCTGDVEATFSNICFLIALPVENTLTLKTAAALRLLRCRTIINGLVIDAQIAL